MSAKSSLELLDFRSDTVTRPNAAMREIMARAEVGDDVMEEDPTVKLLEQRAASLFNREAALYVPSGTMGNLLGIAVHCQRGDEIICERRAHSYVHEVAGASALFGILFTVLDNSDGILTPQQIEEAIRPDDIHEPVSKLVIVENTANLAGGNIVPLNRLQEIRKLTQNLQMKLHMDGARIWNASIATQTPLNEYGQQVDTLMCCLSKGLGCPVGSLLIGNGNDIAKARRLRKMLGGGMRQAGILAACGLYALDHHIERLRDDHLAAQELAQGLAKVLDSRHQVQQPQTNIVLIHTDTAETARATHNRLTKQGILTFQIAARIIRFVTHLDLKPQAVSEAIARLK